MKISNEKKVWMLYAGIFKWLRYNISFKKKSSGFETLYR